jgi:TatD DNase family protein
LKIQTEIERVEAVDAHCHLDSPPLCETLDETLGEARALGVTRWIIGGISPSRWATHRALSQRYEGAYWTAGYHPVSLAQELGGRSTTEHEEALDTLLTQLEEAWRSSSAPVGLGELGLDVRAVAKSTLGLQERFFRAQLDFARENDRPLVLHVVGAHGRTLELLRRDGVSEAGGIVHAFQGSLEVAREYLRLGLFPSLGGGITHPKRRKARATASALALGDFVLETDAPDQPLHHSAWSKVHHSVWSEEDRQTPPAHTPARLIEVARSLATLRRGDELDPPSLLKEIQAILTASGRRAGSIFQLPSLVPSPPQKNIE